MAISDLEEHTILRGPSSAFEVKTELFATLEGELAKVIRA